MILAECAMLARDRISGDHWPDELRLSEIEAMADGYF
jgi:hypothetical protein